MRRSSAPLVIACVALFLSLGGVSYGVATGFIDSREIKNNTIRTKDVRNGQIRSADLRDNDVRGTDVNESTLAKVPSAASADTAGTAGTASTAANAAHAANATDAGAVGGVRARTLNVRQTAGTPFGPVFNFGGLVIEMGCAAAGGGSGDVSYALDTTVPNAEANASGYFFGTLPSPGNRPEYLAPPDFDPGETASLGAGTDGVGGSLFGRYEVNYVTPSGSVVTVSFAVSETTNAFGGTADCILYGHARQSG